MWLAIEQCQSVLLGTPARAARLISTEKACTDHDFWFGTLQTKVTLQLTVSCTVMRDEVRTYAGNQAFDTNRFNQT